jgi:hypothetical protein
MLEGIAVAISDDDCNDGVALGGVGDGTVGVEDCTDEGAVLDGMRDCTLGVEDIT